MTIWHKVDADFWQHPKVVAAGSYAGILFLQVLAVNAKQSRDGTLLPRESDPKLLHGLLAGHGWTLKKTAAALRACVREDLLAIEPSGAIRIVGWDEMWKPPLTTAERSARYRARRNSHAEPVTARHGEVANSHAKRRGE